MLHYPEADFCRKLCFTIQKL